MRVRKKRRERGRREVTKGERRKRRRGRQRGRRRGENSCAAPYSPRSEVRKYLEVTWTWGFETRSLLCSSGCPGTPLCTRLASEAQRSTCVYLRVIGLKACATATGDLELLILLPLPLEGLPRHPP